MKQLVMKSFLLSRLLNVLEVIAPFKHFNKLREFVQMKLPPGFPVKLGKATLTILVYFSKMCVFILYSVSKNSVEFQQRTFT